MENVTETFSLSGNLLKIFNKFLFLHFLNIFNKFVCMGSNSRWKLLYLYGLQNLGLDLMMTETSRENKSESTIDHKIIKGEVYI